MPKIKIINNKPYYWNEFFDTWMPVKKSPLPDTRKKKQDKQEKEQKENDYDRAMEGL